MGLPNGLHHLALNVDDVVEPLEFFTQACGMELVSFYWMHGAKDAYHVFLRLNDHSSVALVRDPSQDGVTSPPDHRGKMTEQRAAGNMQHVSFNVEDEAALLELRDRIRSHGYQTVGPIDHGFCLSLYVPGAPGPFMIEFSTSERPIDPSVWIDPSATEHAGLSYEQVRLYTKPEEFIGKGGAVEQPVYDPGLQKMSDRLAAVLSDPQRHEAFVEAANEPRK